jgi:phage replication-related protein YjqB (UPF0714/DUF867 family)
MRQIATVLHQCSDRTFTIFDASVSQAFSSQSTLQERGEHCSMDPDRLGSLALAPGSQIRVRRNLEEMALYTVSETRQEANPCTVRMSFAGRQRLGTEYEFDAIIDTRVPHPTFSDQEAQAYSELVERLDDNGCQQELIVIAPHGGAIERETDRQAERVASLLGGNRASVWRCKGFKSGGGAFERWHITSTDIHVSSFPLLKTIRSRGFAHAVAFHGFSEAGVLIGGAAPMTLKRKIADALEKALAGSGIHVRVADPSENYDGDSARNIVNRLTAGGANGVQIEQSLEARDRFWKPIADAVASVYSRTRVAPAIRTTAAHGAPRRGRSVPRPRRGRRVV